jgi:hypothetical protein
MGGGAPPDMGGGAPPPPGGAPPEMPSERLVRKDLDLLLEETLMNGSDYMDLSKGRISLNLIDNKLKDLIDK